MKTTLPDDTIIFSDSFQVTKEHTDDLQHVNNIVYLQWIQDISEQHWNTTATPEMREAFVWMVLQHKIDYKHQAFAGDEVTVYTWVAKNEGVKSIRKVQIYKGDTLLVASETLWCLLDKQSLRPKRISEAITKLFMKKSD